MSAPILEFRAVTAVARPSSFYIGAGKRLFDLGLLVLAAPVVLPVTLFILALVALTGANPLYAQLRVGRDGRVFRCWKIRTMVADADECLQNLLARDPAAAQEWEVNQKLRNDPRITRLGRFLRRTSLDELPQLWNVFTGSMSLVGPRPFTPEQAAAYAAGRKDAAYYRLRPGVTGLWQVSRRSEGSFVERAYYDAEYASSLRLSGDVSILARTVGVVLSATGV